MEEEMEKEMEKERQTQNLWCTKSNIDKHNSVEWSVSPKKQTEEGKNHAIPFGFGFNGFCLNVYVDFLLICKLMLQLMNDVYENISACLCHIFSQFVRRFWEIKKTKTQVIVAWNAKQTTHSNCQYFVASIFRTIEIKLWQWDLFMSHQK